MNILTFDIEEWFHINNSDWIEIEKWPDLEKRIENNTQIILTFLRNNNIKATFFVLGWVAEYYPELVKQIANEGHDIGYHSYYHRIPKFQTQKEFEKDLNSGLKLLKIITGKDILYYRAPNFSLKNKWMLDCLIDYGIQVSSSIKNPIINKSINLPDKPFIFCKGNREILEFPLLTKNFYLVKFAYSGGGYFRLLPMSLMKKMLSNNDYILLYLHPNDFDYDIPRKKELGFVRNMLNTVGTKSTLPKLEKLTNQFMFLSISQYIKQIDRNKLIKINL